MAQPDSTHPVIAGERSRSSSVVWLLALGALVALVAVVVMLGRSSAPEPDASAAAPSAPAQPVETAPAPSTPSAAAPTTAPSAAAPTTAPSAAAPTTAPSAAAPTQIPSLLPRGRRSAGRSCRTGTARNPQGGYGSRDPASVVQTEIPAALLARSPAARWLACVRCAWRGRLEAAHRNARGARGSWHLGVLASTRGWNHARLARLAGTLRALAVARRVKCPSSGHFPVPWLEPGGRNARLAGISGALASNERLEMPV